MRRKRTIPLADWFWSRVDKTGECWIWTGGLKPNGYGWFSHQGRRWYAHRFVYELTVGPIPAGMFACHHCDNPPCVNPDHLFLGTQTDNMRDCIAKGRAGFITKPERLARGDRNGRLLHPERYGNVIPPIAQKGETNYAAKLTDVDVLEIRRAYAAREANQRELGERFGISQVKVSQIVLGRVWRHLL